MKPRPLLGVLLAIVSLAILWGVWVQRTELAGLRTEQRQRATAAAARAEAGAQASAATASPAAPAAPSDTPVASAELLRLRSQVTRLVERRRELEGMRAENERLQAQLASRATNGLAATQPPPGYIRKSEARMVGFSTPEDTLQTLLWASRNRDMATLVQAFSPERAAELQEHIAVAKATGKDIFSEQPTPPGLRVLGRKQGPDNGSISLEIELLPEMPPDTITFMQTNGQWKITRD